MRVTSKTNRGIDEPFEQKVVFSLLTVRSFRLGISNLSIRSNESCKSSFARLGLLVLAAVSFWLVNAIRNLFLLVSWRVTAWPPTAALCSEVYLTRDSF
jgi:hypothetical protein